MKEPYKLRFVGLKHGGTLAYFLTADCITGGRGPFVEFTATRESTQRRYDNRLMQALPVEEERRALLAFIEANNVTSMEV